MDSIKADFLVIGAGIAGASAAYYLAERGAVVVLEREAQPGYHATGRSAALYSETYGNFPVRALTVASGPEFRSPPSGFADHALLTPRGALIFGGAGKEAALDHQAAEFGKLVPSVRRLDAADTAALHPLLLPERIAGGVHEPDAMDIDVHAVHGGFLRGLRSRGGTLLTEAELLALERDGGRWLARTRDAVVTAPVVVNAAGAWADVVAVLAGARPVGLSPRRRTAFTFPAPEGLAIATLPMAIEIDEAFYFKPEVGQFLASPADETPMPPCDVQPEELDIAEAAAQIEEWTTLRIRRIANRWAGLRSFVADRTPVVGFDDAADGFFWLAGQGGYGIQTSFAMGRTAAALASGDVLPRDVADLGVSREAIGVARLRR